MTNAYTYIEAPETAKLIRIDLKAKFPGVKFSVKSSRYSMGSSVSISWVDGPTTKQVDYAVALYDFCTYDPYQDYHGTADARLINGQLRKGSAHISTSRQTSAAVVESVVKAANWADSYGVRVGLHSDGMAYILADDHNVQTLCWQALSQWTAFPEVADRDPEAAPVTSDRDAAVRADIQTITAVWGDSVEVFQSSEGVYRVYGRGTVPASGPFLTEGTVAQLLAAWEDSSTITLSPVELEEVKTAAREVFGALFGSEAVETAIQAVSADVRPPVQVWRGRGNIVMQPAAPVVPVVKPRVRVWSDGSQMGEVPAAARVLN